MKVTSNAGHTMFGLGSGAVGYLIESEETRVIHKYFIEGMKKLNHTVYNCTVDKSAEYLKEAVAMANKYDAAYTITHHLNCSDDKSANGVEVWVFDLKDKKTVEVAQKICNEISKLGYRNRGVKENKKFAYLKNTKDKAMIIEYFFCSNKNECNMYDPKKLAEACIRGLTGQAIQNIGGSSQGSQSGVTVGKNQYENKDYNCKAKIKGTEDGFLNIRSDRSAESKILGTVKEGQIITVNYCLNNWFSTWELGAVGYINGKYVELIK